MSVSICLYSGVVCVSAVGDSGLLDYLDGL